MSEPQAGAESPHLDASEREQAASHSTPHPLVVHEVVREEGEAAMERTFSALMWSALAAGMSMGFSFLVQAILESALPPTSWRHLLTSVGYSIGFVFVILGRQQLFTESTLTAVLPVLGRRDLKTVGWILRHSVSRKQNSKLPLKRTRSQNRVRSRGNTATESRSGVRATRASRSAQCSGFRRARAMFC